MPKPKLKVFGGTILVKGKQYRAIVAANSQKKTAEVTNHSLYEIKTWWAETGNKKELEIAIAKPFTMLIKPLDGKDDYQEAVKVLRLEKKS